MKFVTLTNSDSVSLSARPFIVAERASQESNDATPYQMARAGQGAALGARPTSTAILAALGHATFTWEIASDALRWLDGTAAIFGTLAIPAAGTGAEFARLIEPTRSVRLDAVLKSAERDQGGGVAYRIEYGLRADPAANVLWIEECGRWFAGADGAPARVHGVMRIDNERHARDQQLLELSRHDALTGEFNRTHLMTLLAATLDDTARFRTQAAFAVVGIDHLSRINDAFGFDVADQVICEVSARIRARLRGGDVMGRFSGNKFGLILKNCGVDDMQVAADRFLAGVREAVVPTKLGPVAVTVSVGGVSIPRHARSVDEAMNRAQEAFETTKSRRQGSCSIWQPSVERETQRRLNIRVTDEIVTALNQRRIGLGFEPVVKAKAHDEIVFHESLVRMQQDNGEFLLGPNIVPIAEKLGLIRLVDHRVLELVIAELSHASDIQLSLNVSPGTTMDPDWWGILETLLKANPDVASRLIVEITETVAIQGIDDVRGFVSRLKNFGCRIAIDDFGAGYTSFRNLRKLGVDIVKIDGEFVRNITHSSDDRAFVQTLIDLARRLGIKTVAEWVQDAEAAQLLSDWGCDYIQGRLVGLASSRRPWLAVATPPSALPG